MNPSPSIAALGLANGKEDQEFQADLFAATWFRQTAKPEQQERFFRENPEANAAWNGPIAAVACVVLVFVILYAFSKIG
jgi:hypothetical protein